MADPTLVSFPPPVSPCINVCALDADGYCGGCYRTIDEIAHWRSLSPAAQWEVLRELPVRLTARAANLIDQFGDGP